MEKVLPNWMRFKGMNEWMKEVFDFCRDNSVDIVEHFKGLDEFDRERFLRGSFKNYDRIQGLKNQIDKLKNKLLEPYSYESMWKIHSKHQNQISLLKNKLKEKNLKIRNIIHKTDIDSQLREKNQIIENQKEGERSLIQRNMELQYRLSYEERVNRILKERIKNFEELYSGGEVLENIL